MSAKTSPAFEVDADQYWSQGYTVVRGVFSAQEIEQLRERASKTRTHQGDLLANPELHAFPLDPRLVRIARALLGATPVYFGFSSAKFGFSGRGFHKDNADRHDPNAPDWTRGRYTLVRMGVYLQDHSRHSGGLNVRLGSHMEVSADKGRSHYTASATGDVVCWTLRTSHGASGGLLRVAPKLSVAPRLVNLLPDSLFVPEECERIALFVTFALDDAHLDRYLRYLETRAFMVELWRNTVIPDEVIQAVRAREDVIWRDAWAEIQDKPGLGANVEHRDIPY
jgi:hypothetical protein